MRMRGAMMARANIERSVQYKRPTGEWFTIDEAGEAVLVLEGDIMDLLARWVGWFEASGLESGFHRRGIGYNLCACCLRHVADQGHAPDCQYEMSKALLAGRGGE